MPHAALGGLLLLVCGAIAFALMAAPRGDRKMLAGRIERTLGSRTPISISARRYNPAMAWPWWVRWIARRLRLLFTFRLGRGWGVTIRTWKLLAIGVVAAFVVGFVGHQASLPLWLTAPLCVVGLFFAPHFVAQRQQRRALAAFSELFPDTVDMVVRMIRAGLPVGAAVRSVADQDMAPVNGVFREVADQTAIGIPLEEALGMAATRVGDPDFRFFAVAVALQRSTGGNLAVTLETLADIVRKRRAMRLKARATTAEVRVSAYVLGGIPLLVTGGVSMFAPSYLAPLINDPAGNVLAGLALLSLLMAFVTMRWLIRRSMTRI